MRRLLRMENLMKLQPKGQKQVDKCLEQVVLLKMITSGEH